MSILELYDMVKELGYTTLHNMYWKQPWGMLRITPLKTEIDVLSMLGCLPRNKYVHVYIEESVRQKDANENNSEPAWIDEDETIWFDDVDIVDSVRNDGSASNDEESEYIASDNQDSDFDSLLEDSDNDLADGDDEVCNVVVAASRDILGFSSVIKAAVRQYGVLNKYNVKLKVNDSKRLQVICKEGCPWMIWASRLNPKDELDKTWKIKTYIGEHNCIRDTKNGNCTYKWLASTYLEKWRIDPNYSTGSLQGDVRNDHFLEVPISKCSRTKKLALQMIHGNEDEQYERIYDYLGELRGTNPGTTTICHLDNRLFVRMYVCLQACKDGFKVGCKPIISIDGCFLKGHYQGYLLAAVGIDANDCIYPLAYAAVESENRSSWCWFLRNLEADLELTNSYHYTFMSDKQKEIGDLFPNVEHRTCVRHLYTNFKSNSGFQGKALKDALWKAARATYMKEFTDAMKEIRSISEAAFEWLQKKDPSKWSKSHFGTNCKSDMLLNNFSESFNKMILELRDKSILTMMEMIRCKIMNIIATKAEATQKIVGSLCPKIQKKAEATIIQSVRCWPRNTGNNRYEVPARLADQHVVDLGEHTCSCRRWILQV
ncbi:hypothetical protein GQ457_05G019940 [Hibiscus cannabinus]